jgi:heat shock protein HtpX
VAVAALAEVTEPETPVVIPGTRRDHDEAHRNRRRALLLASVPAWVVLGVGAAIGAAAGTVVVGTVAGTGAALVAWWALWRGATPIVLGGLGARTVEEGELARAENLVDGLCASMGVVPPEILVVEEDARDALTLGCRPDSAVLVVTSGLLNALDPVALEGVLAHELVHVKRGDIAPATVAAALLAPLAPLSSSVSEVVHAIAGRGREFRTDRLAVAVTRYPPGLRDALVGMAEGPRPQPPSRLVGRGVARTTRWLWTVALPGGGPAHLAERGAVGELDDPGVRIAALDEW